MIRAMKNRTLRGGNMAGFKKLVFFLKCNKKKEARIHVADTQTKKAIGSFSATIKQPTEFPDWDKLSSEQQFELMMFTDNVRYAVDKLQLDNTLHNFSPMRIFAPDLLVETLEKLYTEAQRQHLTFTPVEAMFNGLLNYMRNVEKKLKKEDPNINILPEAGIELASPQEIFKKEKGKYIRKIFHALSQIENVQNKFLNASHAFNKEQTLTYNIIKLISEGKSKVSTWQIACALVVLGKEKATFITAFPHSVLIDLWLTPLLKAETITTLSKAKADFKETFPGVGDPMCYEEEIKTHIDKFNAKV